MNLLAHALLSPPNPAILVGNLTADWVKGKARLTLPEDLQTGMALHQKIDLFTDTHPAVAHCCELFAPRWSRYSPVLVDIFFDYLLSNDWHRHLLLPREAYIRHTHHALRAHRHLLPQRAEYAASALLADDWLTAYGSLDGIALSLTRLSFRLNHGLQLAPAVTDFLAHQPAFECAFREFFPQLRRHVESHLSPAVHSSS